MSGAGKRTSGRPQSAVRGDGATSRFARALRGLRERSGTPTYREMARRAHFSYTALSKAADGRRMPGLELTLAYVRACGCDEREVDQWQRLWQRAQAELAQALQTQAFASLLRTRRRHDRASVVLVDREHFHLRGYREV
ncbi:helix-turn-helix domain-containing protein [Kutzneria viridogrisea]